MGKMNKSNNSRSLSRDFDCMPHPEEKVDIIQTIKQISEVLFPVYFFFIGLFFQQTINLMFIGHTYDEETRKDALDAIGISHVYINCSLLSLVIGIISGFDTVGANAFGSKKYYLFGIYYQRAQLIGGVVALISLIFQYLFAVRILFWIGLDDKVMALVSEYIHIFMLFVIFDGQAALNFRYLNVIGKSKINMIFVATTLALHPLWCYILINVLGMGIRGAALSLLFSQMLNAGGGFLYVYLYNPVPESVFFYSRDSFIGWGEYLKLAVPSACLMCFEWWAYEIMAVVVIWIGKLDYTVHVLLANISTSIFTTSLAFSISTTVILGNAVTTHSKSYLKYMMKIMVGYGLVFMAFLSMTIFLLRNYIFYMFIDDEEVVQLGITVIPLICFYNMFDNFQFICNGIFRALGKQLVASYVTFFNMYITQTVVAIVLGKLLGWGVYGVWVGFIVGSFFNDITYIIILYHFDLDKIKEEIKQRIKRDHDQLTDGVSKTTPLINKEYELKEIL